MPITVTLTAIPGRLEKGYGYCSKILDVPGVLLGSETLSLDPKIGAVRAAVVNFGARMRQANPDASFSVLVNLTRGQCKPNGFDDAYKNNGFGQDHYLRVISAFHAADPGG